MKTFYSFFFLLLFFSGRAFAQSAVTFASRVNTSTPVNFVVGGIVSGDPDPTHYVPIPTSTVSLNYQFTLYKTKGVTTKGYVSIFASTTTSNLNKPEIIKITIPSTNWQPVYSTGGISNEETISFNGNLTLSSTQATNNNGLYAVYVNTLVTPEQQVEVTAPIRLGAPAATSPTPSTGASELPIIYSISPAQGSAGTVVSVDIICNSVAVPYKNDGSNGPYSTFKIGESFVDENQTSSFYDYASGQNRCRCKVYIPGNYSGPYVVSVVRGFTSSRTSYPSNVYYNVNPKVITDFIPCSNSEICSDQCISYGAIPQEIKGRILANDNITIFRAYSDFISAQNQPAFAQGSEFEQVQWQYSYDQTNWTDISGANGSNYQPGILNRTTYYRRSSTHGLCSEIYSGRNRIFSC